MINVCEYVAGDSFYGVVFGVYVYVRHGTFTYIKFVHLSTQTNAGDGDLPDIFFLSFLLFCSTLGAMW